MREPSARFGREIMGLSGRCFRSEFGLEAPARRRLAAFFSPPAGFSARPHFFCQDPLPASAPPCILSYGKYR